MVEVTEVRCAERLASVPEDKDVRLLAGVACPAGVTVCENGIVMTGTVGTLSPSDYDGPVGPVGTLSPSDSDYVDPDGTLSSSDLAEILAMDVRQAVPNVIDRHAVVAMVGISTTQMGQDAPMDGDSDCTERDILNEFETVNGMPVYYGGDLHDSDCEDPRDLAYTDWVDWCDFSGPH